MSIVEHLESNPVIGWESIFEELNEEIRNVSNNILKLSPTGDYYPRLDDVFNAFRLTPYHNVKVVILGQDPYPTYLDDLDMPRAMGLSFSVRQSDKIPQSLLNIYKELTNEYSSFPKNVSGDLTSWAKQGVLLLNGGSLTYNRAAVSNEKLSHLSSGIWNAFMTKMLQILAKNKNIIFVAWGNHAKSICTIANLPHMKCEILECPHPVARGNNIFMGNNHFRLINDSLAKKGLDWIDWGLLENKN